MTPGNMSFVLILLALLASCPAHVSSFLTPPTTHLAVQGVHGLTAAASKSPRHSRDTALEDAGGRVGDLSERRAFLRTALAAPLATAALAPAGPAAAVADDRPAPVVPLQTTARRLRPVPVFAIVDGEGTPFHTYDKQTAGGNGYFFTSYAAAEYVLDDAKKAFAKAKDEAAKNNAKDAGSRAEGSLGEDGSGEVPDSWGQARIVSLPLDVVMQLIVKKTRSVAQNGKGKEFSTYYQVLPDAADQSAALRIENSPRYGERGRVPLFYVDGLTLAASSSTTAAAEEGGGGGGPPEEMAPVYFRTQDLRAEWERQHPGTDLPAVRVRELNETFLTLIRPGSGKSGESVKNLVFVPNPESVERAKTLGRGYKLGQMILTK